jgi:hypothetical protein
MARKSRRLSIDAEHKLSERSAFALHGARVLPRVEVTSYNLEISEGSEFVGDRANKAALIDLVEDWRKIVSQNGDDPLAGISKKRLSRAAMEKLLKKGAPEAAGVIQSAINDFAERLVQVIEKYSASVAEWKNVKLVIVGGGLSGSAIGKLAIGRAQAVLSKKKKRVVLRPIASDPDDAALLGGLQLIPSWFLAGFNTVFAVDIGGSNVRIGAIRFKLDRKLAIAKSKVVFREHWSHAKADARRQDILDFITEKLKSAVKWSRTKRLKPAPFVAVACPGRIRADGTVDRGAQNLPGRWESDRFSLPQYIREHLEILPMQDTVVVMHNDAILQGLSELTSIGEKNYGVLTIGTGLGNGTFQRRGEA